MAGMSVYSFYIFDRHSEHSCAVPCIHGHRIG